MGAGLGGGGLAAGQTLVAPHAIPGPLPTAEPALPSLSHPQHSHTTTTTQPHPTATLPQPAPPTIYSIVQKILHICFPAVREFLQCNYTPGRQRPEANLLEFAASSIPHSPAVLPGRGPSSSLSVTLESSAATKGLSAVWLRVSGPQSVQSTLQ